MHPSASHQSDAVSDLPSQPERSDSFSVLFFIRSLQIIKQLASSCHEVEEAATRMVVFLVSFEVLGEIFDA